MNCRNNPSNSQSSASNLRLVLLRALPKAGISLPLPESIAYFGGDYILLVPSHLTDREIIDCALSEYILGFALPAAARIFEFEFFAFSLDGTGPRSIRCSETVRLDEERAIQMRELVHDFAKLKLADRG